MSAEVSDHDQAGRCWGCGYLLRGVESSQCPECGRAFDRADRRTMNFGRPMGRTAQRALRPLGGWMLLLALLGVLLIGWTTRWPVRGWHFSFLDLRFYAALGRWRTESPGMSAVDAAYTIGLLLMAAVGVCWLIGLMLRLVTLMLYRPPRDLRGLFWRRSILVLLLIGLSIACIGIGWPYRLGQRWARQWEVESKLPNTAGFEPPLLAEAGADVPLRAVLLRGRTAHERRVGMKTLVEAWMPVNLDRDQLLLDVLNSETDPENKVMALHLAGEYGGLKFESELAARLSDPSPEIRIAAADGLGILWNDGAAPGRVRVEENKGDPPIDWVDGFYGDRQAVRSTSNRQRLQSMMLSAATLDEREAAARALTQPPAPGYRLRYAEWGVLIGEGPGKIRFTNALKVDIPPFVHPVGNPVAELENRITNVKPHGMGKPVVHLTVDQPMAVSVEIGINEGRPWFAYPAFDDLILLEGDFGASRQPQERFYDPVGPMPTIRQLDPKGLPPLANLREGYAWSSPQHRDYPWYDPTARWSIQRRDFGKLGTVRGMGMLWQSLIVTPTPLASAQLADVPKDARYDWWRRLRQTPCSWISSRGETERFLYYDGPTIMPSPVIMKLENGQLKWTTEDYSKREDRPLNAYTRSALYVETRGGKLSGFWIDSDALTIENVENVSASLAQKPAITVAQFTARLIKHGLAEPEAQALLACWRKTFFETEGRRTLVILSPADYQALCPLNIWPVPTEQARVGIVWTEFPQ